VSAPVVFLDTETTGVHLGRQIYEIAMVRREGDKPEVTRTLMLEVDISEADPTGLKIGGFYERHPLGRYLSGRSTSNPRESRLTLCTRQAAAELVARATHGAHLVGALPWFDTEKLAELLREHGLTPAWHYHLIDVESRCVGWQHAHGQDVPLPYRSDDLSRLVGVDPEQFKRHEALGDVQWAMALYDATGLHAQRQAA
jgi:DNA polymerase III epsilon subunit-like protein